MQLTLVLCEREDCVIFRKHSSTTLIGWTQTFDKWGTPLNTDPNKTTTTWGCDKCGKEWTTTE